ncbi:MAG: GDSL-type esterase/lipase family protein [Pirellulaceae bacterium]
MFIKLCLCYVLAQVAAPAKPFSAVSDTDPLVKYRAAAIERWEEDIRKLEQLDEKESDPEHAILFVGSSSIRLWETMPEDMAPWPTIRRGYGGAKLSDLAVFVERLVKPHQFDALAIFVANDISNSKNENQPDKSPEEVLELYKLIVSKVRQSHPTQPIAFIAITPTSSRFEVWNQIKRANQLIEDYCDQDETLFFIATADAYLKDGKPNDGLFRDDKLHLNRDGYRIWGKLMREAMARILPEHAATKGTGA